MKLSTRVYFVLFILIFGINLSGVSQVNKADTTSTSNSSVDTVSTDSALVDTTVGQPDLAKSLSQLEQGQEVLFDNLSSAQASIKELGNRQTASSDFWLYITIILLSVLSIISFGTSYYLYRTRTIMVKDTKALVPQEWGRYLEEVGENLGKLGSGVGKRLKNLQGMTQENTQKIESMIETHMSLQDALDEKDKEIKRLKNGYDKEIYRNFLYRFIRVDQTLEEYLGEGEITQKEIKMVQRLLEDAFLECGVERFKPEVGEDYASAKGVDENPERIVTDEDKKEFTIASVKEEGYKLNGGERDEILVPAQVKIYVTEN